MKLDLGCGTTPQEGHVGIDLPATEDEELLAETLPSQATVDPGGIIRFDLASGIPWPFEDESIEGLFSSHVIEHLPAARITVYGWAAGALNQRVLRRLGTQDALFWFLDEAWRVCKPGAEFLLRWPALKDERDGSLQATAFLDGTHYRFIPFEQCVYWSRKGREAMGVAQYRVRCNWVPKQKSQRELVGGIRVIENELVLVKEI